MKIRQIPYQYSGQIFCRNGLYLEGSVVKLLLEGSQLGMSLISLIYCELET